MIPRPTQTLPGSSMEHKRCTRNEMAHETILVIRGFTNACVVTIEEVISELEKTGAQIKELQGQKINLESDFAQ